MNNSQHIWGLRCTSACGHSLPGWTTLCPYLGVMCLHMCSIHLVSPTHEHCSSNFLLSLFHTRFFLSTGSFSLALKMLSFLFCFHILRHSVLFSNSLKELSTRIVSISLLSFSFQFIFIRLLLLPFYKNCHNLVHPHLPAPITTFNGLFSFQLTQLAADSYLLVTLLLDYWTIPPSWFSFFADESFSIFFSSFSHLTNFLMLECLSAQCLDFSSHAHSLDTF